MSITIPANDHGQIRVFATTANLSNAALSKTPGGLAEIFGVDQLDATYVDIIKISDLSAMSLTQYIQHGYNMPTQQFEQPVIDGIEGYAILVLSRASRGVETELTLAPGIRHVTTYVDPARLIPPVSLPDASAKGNLAGDTTKAPKSDARIGGMVATIVLLLLFALVGLMIWVAG